MSFPETTPVRAVPGAFLNTPAVASRFRTEQDPVSKNLFPRSESGQRAAPGSLRRNSSSSTSRSRAVARSGLVPGKTAGSLLDMTAQSGDATAVAPANPVPIRRVENIPPVVRAARAINGSLTSDENFPDIDSYCRRKDTLTESSGIVVKTANLLLTQRAHHPTMKSPSSTPPGRLFTRFTCTPYQIKSSITTTPASCRH